MEIKAFAKINLFLDIVGKLPNGYHEIKSVMQTVSLCDTLTVTKTDKGISLSAENLSIENEKNIVYKAASRFFEKVDGGVGILLRKRIPQAAGLGGGSADAAAVLSALNTLYNNPYSKTELHQIATSLGADVPFLLTGGTCLCEGIGEKITPLDQIPELYVVIAKKGVKASTAEMYRKIDEKEAKVNLNAKKFISLLSENNLKEAFLYSGNIFEQFYSDEDCLNLKREMLSFGAVYSGLSGAGPSVIGLFENKEAAEKCADSFNREGIENYLCKTV